MAATHRPVDPTWRFEVRTRACRGRRAPSLRAPLQQQLVCPARRVQLAAARWQREQQQAAAAHRLAARLGSAPARNAGRPAGAEPAARFGATGGAFGAKEANAAPQPRGVLQQAGAAPLEGPFCQQRESWLRGLTSPWQGLFNILGSRLRVAG